MTTIAETLQALKEEFASLPDGFARYAYLTELSALLAPPPEVRRAEYSYRGCQSQVWLCARADAGVCRLAADSDTLIIRGVLALFRELLEGQAVEEVLRSDFNLLQELGLSEHFSSTRTAGVAGLLPEIRRQLSQTDSQSPF